MEDTLHCRLARLAESDMYPFHMPGHKRQMKGEPWQDICRLDITEIDGFDNLHCPEGILKREQERAARLYGSRRSYFLVNGASCGVLAAILALTKEGDKILMARGSHKSAYHAAHLGRLRPVYLLGKKAPDGFPPGPVDASEVAEKMRESGAKTVFLTSPTYEGILSDISAIAAVVHDGGGLLIVDEAHGAHLPFHAGFGKSAVICGADLVIHSLHKTMPAMTQTALLHVCSGRVDAERVQRLLGVFQTSSPSYVLMASISDCILLTEEKGREMFDAYAERLRDFYERTRELKKLFVLDRDLARRMYGAEKDPSKIVICTKHLKAPGGSAFRGPQLQRQLRERYHLETEMAAGDYVLAMTSVMDTQEGFDRLVSALFALDGELVCDDGADSMQAGEEVCDDEAASMSDSEAACNDEADSVQAGEEVRDDGADSMQDSGAALTGTGCGAAAMVYSPQADDRLRLPACAMPPYEAEAAASEVVETMRAAGRISGDYLYLYPPGTPILVPGEIIEQDLLERIGRLAEAGLSLQGTQSGSWKKIQVVKEIL